MGGRRGAPGARDRLRGWHLCETLGDAEEQERLLDGFADSHPGMVDRSEAEIAREMRKTLGRFIERHRGPYNSGSLHAGGGPPTFTGTNSYPIV